MDTDKCSDSKKRWQPYLTVLVFGLLLFGFTAATVFGSTAEFSETENRVLAQKPELKWDAILSGDFASDYEAYLTDQFIGRDRWIGLKTSVERLLLKRESKDIYFGEDGYLIEKHSGTFTTPMAEQNAEALVAFAEQYADQFGETHLSIIIVPNAVDILQDRLPPLANPGDGRDYLEYIAQELPEGVWLDATSVLEEHRAEEIYYRTDHHWKTLGAFYVYQEWAKVQGYSVPELEDYEIRTVTDSFEGTVQSKLGIRTGDDTIELFLPAEEMACSVYHDYEGTHSEETEGDIEAAKNSLYDYAALETKDKYAVFLGGNEPFVRIRRNSASRDDFLTSYPADETGQRLMAADHIGGRRILVIKDSYANCFLPFMVGEFQEIHVLDLRYTSRKLSSLIEEGEYTDLLVLYNASGFAEDMSIVKLKN